MSELPAIFNSIMTNQTYSGDAFKLLGLQNAVNSIQAAYPLVMTPQPKETKMADKNTKGRIVKVLIVDPDKNVPLKDSFLHKGEDELTDLNDQELFFELDIKSLLTKHNEKRSQMLDKSATEKLGKDVKLEPARVRDLRMIVVTVAEF